MQPESFFLKLHETLSEADCQIIVSALRQDRIVWESLQKEEFFRTVVTAAGTTVHCWNPANLALTWLQISETVDNLRSYPLIPLESELRQTVADTYEETIRSAKIPETLGEAGFIALALRERRRLTDSWKGLLNELQFNPPVPVSVWLEVWATPVACLLGLAPDPSELLQELAPVSLADGDPQEIDLALHAVLSNPLPLTEQVSLLIRLIGRYPASEQLLWLQRVEALSRHDLVVQIAGHLLQKEEVSKTRSKDFRNGKSHPYLSQLPEYRLGNFYNYAGNPEMSIPMLLETQQALRQVQAHVARQVAETFESNNDYSSALKARREVVDLEGGASSAMAEYAHTLLSAGYLSEANSVLENESHDPNIIIAKGRLAALQGDIARAQEYSHTFFLSIAADSKSVIEGKAALRTTSAFLKTLLGIGLVNEANQITEKVIHNRPNDVDLLYVLAESKRLAGNTQQAIDAASLAISLQPENLSLRRSLAHAFEQEENWESALLARKDIVLRSEDISVEDLLSLARCAVHAGEPEEANDAANAVLKMYPENGPAHAYLGEAALLEGSKEAAIEHFTQGTLVSPEDSLSWLGLSRLYQAQADENKSLSTLREAVLASPESADIHYYLGEQLLANNSPSEALPALRKAATLDPKSVPYALRLEAVLEELGHLDEAKEVVERTRQYWPQQPELAFAHGKVLLSLGETKAAVSPLRVKLFTEPGELDPYILYARALANLPGDKGPGTTERFGATMDDGIDPFTDARRALEKALQIDPNSIEAKVLLAENLAGSGYLQEASDIFLSLSESLSPQDISWNGRIKLGLGKTSLLLGNTDAALASLQEAAAEMPDHLPAQQALAEAYLSFGLNQDAYQAAQNALRLYPADCQNLVWYAGLMYSLGVYPESIATLERACELSQDTGELYLKMVQVYLRAENLTSARAALDTLMASEMISSEELRQASHGWLVLGETDQAIACLEKALHTNEAPDTLLRFELAQILDQTDRPEDALQELQESLDACPDQRKVYIAQAHILAKTGHFSEALSALEMALRIPDDNPTADVHTPSMPKRARIPEIAEPNFKPVQTDLPHIHLQMGAILRKTGNIAGALEHAVRAVELSPEDAEIAAIGADVAFSRLALEQAQALSEKAIERILSEKNSESYGKDRRSGLDEADVNASIVLLCTNAELALENEQVDKAKELLATANALRPAHPRLLAIQARIAALAGEMQLGEQLYESATSNLGVPSTDQSGFTAAKSTEDVVLGYPALTLAQAALELQHWDEAIQLFYQAVKNTPDEARSHLFLARGLVRSAENQRLLKSLRVVHHLPGDDKFGDGNLKLFEKSIQACSRLSDSKLISRWRTRGYAAFQSDPRNADLLSQLPPSADDAAAQAAIAIASHEPLKAMEYVKPFAKHPKALMQMALASQEENPVDGFFAARSLVGYQPGSPVNQAALAILAAQVEELEIAKDAIGKALDIWPNEPEWHSLAAEINLECGDFNQAVDHQLQAHHLDRSNPVYALALAKSYLKSGKTGDAIHILEEASQLSPDDVDVWLSLAEAQSTNRDLTAAIASAEKAISIAPQQIQPVLLCGELALKAGQTELACQRAIHAASIDPGEARAALLFAQSMVAKGQHEEALKSIESALGTVREPYSLQLERVSLARKLRGTEAALQMLQSLASTYPDEPAVHTLLAEALIEAGQREQAERAAQAALRLQPDQPSLHLMVGRLQRTSGQLDQAIHHLSEVIRLSPKEVDAYLELGRAYQDRREYNQALSIYNQAIQISSRDPRPYYQAGLALKESKDYSGAEKMLRRAADIAPEDVNIRRQLGAIIALNLVRNLQEAS